MSIAINELKAMDFTFLKRNPEEQDYTNDQKKDIELLEKSEGISLDNKEANRQKLMETANLLRSAQANEIPADTSKKSKLGVNNDKCLRGLISKLSDEDEHEIVYSALLDAYYEENADIMKKGVFANINRYVHRAYINYLTDLWINGQYPLNEDIIEYLNMFPYPGPYSPIYVMRMWTMMLLICARFRIINILNNIYFWPLF